MYRTNIFPGSARLACAGAIALALAACATVPTPLQGQFPPLTPHDARAGALTGPVRWGGEILNVDTRADQTCFEILARDLDASARPIARDPSGGRFLACRNGFYDPEEFSKGRDITIVGQLDGTENGKVGDFNYTYPRVAAETIYLWPERPLYVNRPYYDPWGPWGYGPYWGPYWGYGPYWGGPTIIVRHPSPPPPPPPKGG